jgi:hypothetical protein
VFVYHNTIIGEQTARDPSANMHFRNNLFLGRDTPERGIMAWANATDAYSTDYNGFRPNRGVARQYQWLGPTGARMYDLRPRIGRASPRWPTTRSHDAGDTRHESISTFSNGWLP